nr:MAG TPA: hypothetical protein [Caudoviricetes sp.]
MINKIDWLANRVLFSIFDLAAPLYCLNLKRKFYYD